MKPIEIADPDDQRLRIPFKVPVKGRKPLQFSLPRFDFMPEDDFDDMTEELKAVDEQEDLSMRQRGRHVALAMMRRFVTPTQLETLETLTAGQLDQILTAWTKHSQVELGELLASDDSSTENTEAPSTTTSSAPAITAVTSAAS